MQCNTINARKLLLLFSPAVLAATSRQAEPPYKDWQMRHFSSGFLLSRKFASAVLSEWYAEAEADRLYSSTALAVAVNSLVETNKIQIFAGRPALAVPFSQASAQQTGLPEALVLAAQKLALDRGPGCLSVTKLNGHIYATTDHGDYEIQHTQFGKIRPSGLDAAVKKRTQELRDSGNNKLHLIVCFKARLRECIVHYISAYNRSYTRRRL